MCPRNIIKRKKLESSYTSLENKTFTDADFNKKKSQRFYRLRLID